ncbi:S-adenosyl-L-methionine-dependent methyltransferase [Auricularia subglabra TFB-10046 SS5]|nr:S-adenosyl-L-methionine-dependent methyltransferase [Auricularia subglabra TFB-10046 SS5]
MPASEDDETSPSGFQRFSLARRDRASLLASLPRLMIPIRAQTATAGAGVYDDAAEPELHSPVSDEPESLRSPSPSIISYNSARDASRLLKEMLGRCFNTTNDLYALPADETEFSRLDKQHLMLLVAIGGLYIAKDTVRRALAPEEGVQRRILDLGTGGGNWAIGMGHEFPDAEVVGVDLAPSTTRNPPPNVRFEFDDFGLGLPHFYGQFDVVHARSTANGVRDYEEFIEECVRCLRPGGVLLLVEGDMTLFGEDLRPFPLAGLQTEAREAMKLRGSSMGSGGKFRAFLGRRTDLVNVGCAEVFTNVGPWKKGAFVYCAVEGPYNVRLGPTTEATAHYNLIGGLMRQNARAFVRSLRIFLIQTGFSPERVDQLIAATDEELDEMSVHMYTAWHYAWAEKVASPSDDAESPQY